MKMLTSIILSLSIALSFLACGGSSGGGGETPPPPTNRAPVFTSTANFSVAENQTEVGSVTASDADGDTLSFSITGGADSALFNINSTSGLLSFNTAPDFESPSDSDTNNVYLLDLSVSDGSTSAQQSVEVTVTDVTEDVPGLSERPSNTSCAIPDAPVLDNAISVERVFTSLSFARPIALRQSPVISDRWYVAEQGGVIHTFLSGDAEPTVFADLTDRVSDSSNEMGLLGMAFHPNFANNNYVYLYFSTNRNGGHDSVISRFTATSASTLDTQSELVIMQIDQPYSNHNGGNILFGDDGYLYIGMGDGGSGGDPQNYAQNNNSLLGKMLRIDVDQTSEGRNYAIPADNPFVGTDGLDEIYATGLRNP